MENQNKPKKKFYKRWWLWMLIVIAAIIVAAAVSGPSSPPSPPQGGPALIGFGATQDEWNSNHATDPSRNVRYIVETVAGGRVLNYEMRLPDGQSIDQAKAASLKEFPSDATMVWFVQKSQCSQMEIKSNTLGSALSNPAIGDSSGTALVEFQSQVSGADGSYDPANNNDIFFSVGSYPTAADAPGC